MKAVLAGCAQVKKEYLDLYQKYAPLWEKEEEERSERWASFLATFVGVGANAPLRCAVLILPEAQPVKGCVSRRSAASHHTLGKFFAHSGLLSALLYAVEDNVASERMHQRAGTRRSALRRCPRLSMRWQSAEPWRSRPHQQTRWHGSSSCARWCRLVSRW